MTDSRRDYTVVPLYASAQGGTPVASVAFCHAAFMLNTPHVTRTSGRYVVPDLDAFERSYHTHIRAGARTLRRLAC